MQQIDCNKYPLIGKLISHSLRSDQKIHRSVLKANHNGQISIYYCDNTFILECDTDGDHNPNEYYFFREIERTDAYNILAAMCTRLGEPLCDTINLITDQTMNFLKML